MVRPFSHALRGEYQIFEAYAKAHRLGIESENHAREVKFRAARRIGELVPPVERKETGRGKKLSEERRVSDIPQQRLSDFRKLAEIPIQMNFKNINQDRRFQAGK